jgi:hypothetical protein
LREVWGQNTACGSNQDHHNLRWSSNLEDSRFRHYTKVLLSCLTSEYWLFATLAGAYFFFFGLNRGGANVFIEVGIGFVLLNIITRDYRLNNLSIAHLTTIAVCAYLLILSLTVAPQHSHLRWMKHLVRMLGIVLVIHCLFLKRPAQRNINLFALVVPLSVCCQFIAKYVFQMPNGTFTNIHYLASFAVLSLTMTFFFFRITRSWFRFLFLGVALMAADLLFRTGSRPTILGLAVGIAVVLIFLSGRRAKWIGFSAAVVVLAGLYFTQYAGIVDRFWELFSNFLSEERFELWYRAGNALANNSIGDWLFGHGIDKFHVIYSGVKVIKPKIMVFPHFFGLELIYLNGILGAVLVLGGLAYLGVRAVICAKRHIDPTHALFLNCLIVAFVSWFFYSSLNFPFYSKYAQYPLGFILGTLLVVLEQDHRAVGEMPGGESDESRSRALDLKPQRNP